MKPNPESFEGKLFIPRNAEGEQNTKELAIIHDMQQRMEDHPAFVGLAPGGSVMRGYSTEGSDIDVWVVFDPTKVPPDDYERINQNGFNLFREFREQGVHLLFTSLSPRALNFDSYIDTKGKTQFTTDVPDIMATLTGIVTGKEIGRYREEIKGRLQNLTLEQREALKQQTLEALEERDRGSIKKVAKRIPGAEEETDAILTEWKKLWEERWKSIWETADE